MKVVALTVGNKEAGSTYYRLYQYNNLFKDSGIDIRYIEAKDFGVQHVKDLSEADCVINQKCLFKISLSRTILKASRRVIFDFDDAIYTRPGKDYGWWTKRKTLKRFDFWMKHADMVTAPSQYLLEVAKDHGAKKRLKIPMTLNLKNWNVKKETLNEPLRIGWAGAPHNIKYLSGILPTIEKLVRAGTIEFYIYSGQDPNFSFEYKYVPFIFGTEHLFIRQLDVGLMPLTEELYSYGKSPIKALQYLAGDVYIFGDIIGAGLEMLDACQKNYVYPINDLEKCLNGHFLKENFLKRSKNLVDHDCDLIFKDLMKVLK